jgi:hypothetical protein
MRSAWISNYVSYFSTTCWLTSLSREWNLLTHRHFSAFTYSSVSAAFPSFRSNTLDVTLKVYQGLPRGRVLNPVLLALYMTPLDGGVRDSCIVLQFADEIALYYPDGARTRYRHNECLIGGQRLDLVWQASVLSLHQKQDKSYNGLWRPYKAVRC